MIDSVQHDEANTGVIPFTLNATNDIIHTFDNQCADRDLTKDHTTQTDSVCDQVNFQLVSDVLRDGFFCNDRHY